MSRKLVNDESKIYNVIVEYLKEKRELNLDSVVPFLKNKLRKTYGEISNEVIMEILQSLIQHKLIVEGSRIVRYETLENPKRREIYRFIVDNPGVYHYEIIKHLELASHVVIWHLRVLKNFKLIKQTKIDNHDVYFDKAVNINEIRRKYFLRREKSQRIISILRNESVSMTKTALSRKLKMHPNTVKKYVDALKDIGILLEEKHDNKTNYQLNPQNENIDEESKIILE